MLIKYAQYSANMCYAEYLDTKFIVVVRRRHYHHHEGFLLVFSLILLRSLEPKINIQIHSQVLFCKVTKTKQHNWKVLLSGFHLIDHTVGFPPQIQKLEPPCTA